MAPHSKTPFFFFQNKSHIPLRQLLQRFANTLQKFPWEDHDSCWNTVSDLPWHRRRA